MVLDSRFIERWMYVVGVQGSGPCLGISRLLWTGKEMRNKTARKRTLSMLLPMVVPIHVVIQASEQIHG